jgi:ribosome-binding factor A
VLQALAHSESFLRRALAENLNLRFVPELTFQLDTSGRRGQRVDELLAQITGPSERHG